MRTSFIVFLGILLAGLSSAHQAWTDEPLLTITFQGDGQEPPVIAQAAEAEYDERTGQHQLIGRVRLTYQDEVLQADRVLWDEKTNTAEASGSVRLETKDFVILAERVAVNLELQLAKVYQGRAYFQKRNYYFSGDLIERQSGNVLYIKNGQATTCDGPDPAWSIRAEELTITQEGYAQAGGVTLDTKYLPIFYTPYFVFPVKNERQTGVLLPGFTSSTRDGVTFSLPFFWATGENHDLTYIPVWREKRGFSSTLEGRYHWEHGRGIWLGTYLKDRRPQKFQYDTGEAASPRERYWVRAQNQWQYGEWDFNLDLDLVSDPFFLYEYKDDPDGFFYSQNLMSGNFARSLNEYLDPVRQSSFFAQIRQYDSVFRGTLEYNEDLYKKNNLDTLQRLPSLSYSLVGRPWADVLPGFDGLASQPRLDLAVQYDYFTRTSGSRSLTNETGHRLVVAPAVNWTTNVGDWGNFYFGGELDLALYAPDGYRPSIYGVNDPQARHSTFDSRLIGSFETSLSTTLSKVYEDVPGQALAVRHQMTPIISFNYVETPDQSSLPYWDIYDRRLSRRTLRYGLLNTLVAKNPERDASGNITGFSYDQFLKVGLWSSYEFKSNLTWANDKLARYYTVDYFDRGSGPFEIEVETFFNPAFSLRFLSGMDTRTGDFVSHDISFRAQTPRGDSLTMTYDYDQPSTVLGTAEDWGYRAYEELRADLHINLTSEWSVGFSTRYNLDRDNFLESYAQLRYQAQCYGLSLLYSDHYGDQRVTLAVDLLGLGSLAQSENYLATPPRQ